MESDVCTSDLDQLKNDLHKFIDDEDPLKLKVEIIELPFDG